MAFEKEMPRWEKKGTEPPDSKKITGWDAGDKPPADYFNWQWNGAYEAVKELQEKAAEKSYVDEKLSHIDLSAEKVKLDSPDFVSKNVKDGMEELFTSVSDGKDNIAAAITDMNQPASGSDTFPQLAQKIRDISSDATATAGDILSGQTAYARGQKITGTIVRRTGNVNAQSISRSGTTLRLRPQAGYYPGDTANSVQITHPTIAPENIKAGVNFAGSGLIGTLEEGLPIRPGNVIAHTNQASNTTSSTTWETLKESVINVSGIYRVSYEFTARYYDGFSKITINGVDYGQERRHESSAGVFITYEEDIALSKGDVIRIMGRAINIHAEATGRNLRLLINPTDVARSVL